MKSIQAQLIKRTPVWTSSSIATVKYHVPTLTRHTSSDASFFASNSLVPFSRYKDKRCNQHIKLISKVVLMAVKVTEASNSFIMPSASVNPNQFNLGYTRPLFSQRVHAMGIHDQR